jgi:periplasmic copper chaperone A
MKGGRRLVASAVLTGGFLVAGLVFAGSASAHVKVSGVDAVQGGSGVITFRVPSESDTASTTGLLITFPAATPFTSVDVQPKAGWTAKVTKKPLPHPLTDDDGDAITDYVAQVDFTATGSGAGAGIPPGEFDMFNLSVGPFPKAPNMTFAALQTYSDGSTVNWDEKSANGTEPDHPAPVLQLAAAAGAQAATAGQTGANMGASQPVTGSSASGGSPSWPGITGLIAGLAALVVAVAALITARSRGRAAPPA